VDVKSLLLGLGLGSCVIATGACFFHDDDPEPTAPVTECTVDTDCAHLDTGDACFAPARCDAQGSCTRDFLQDEDECQCGFWTHCLALGYEQEGCNEITCNEVTHQCGEDIAPAGPAPDQTEGDCSVTTCDGETAIGKIEDDADDVADDNNPCTVDSCGEAGPLFEALADGSECLDGSGICYASLCYPGCIPADPEACGGEGPSEPQNDTSPSQTGENNPVCGMLDEDDVDFFELYIEDEDFKSDIMGFDVHSSAPTIELCAYVLCNNHAGGGYPDGGCSNKVDGPNGSAGCCWQGAPESLDPTWDLDCTGDDDDSGTLYFSVRALGGDACDTYTVSAHY
jgi:hypothetical protein